MDCNDPSDSDEAKAQAALENMDEKAVILMRKLMDRDAKKESKRPRANLKLVKMPED